MTLGLECKRGVRSDGFCHAWKDCPWSVAGGWAREGSADLALYRFLKEWSADLSRDTNTIHQRARSAAFR